MANPIRGEIDFAAGDVKCKLCLDVDAICNIEAATDLGFGEIVDRALRRRSANYRIARAMLVAASRGSIGDDKAVELVGNHAVTVWPQMISLVVAALPSATEDNGDADPPQAGDQVGIGKDS